MNENDLKRLKAVADYNRAVARLDLVGAIRIIDEEILPGIPDDLLAEIERWGKLREAVVNQEANRRSFWYRVGVRRRAMPMVASVDVHG